MPDGCLGWWIGKQGRGHSSTSFRYRLSSPSLRTQVTADPLAVAPSHTHARTYPAQSYPQHKSLSLQSLPPSLAHGRLGRPRRVLLARRARERRLDPHRQPPTQRVEVGGGVGHVHAQQVRAHPCRRVAPPDAAAECQQPVHLSCGHEGGGKGGEQRVGHTNRDRSEVRLEDTTRSWCKWAEGWTGRRTSARM
jgi:hypothetical protein